MTYHMITAKDARTMAGPTLAERLEALGQDIETLAKKGEREIKLHDTFWLKGYDSADEWLAAKKALEELGYTVDFVYEERQFVDMYTRVRW